MDINYISGEIAIFIVAIVATGIAVVLFLGFCAILFAGADFIGGIITGVRMDKAASSGAEGYVDAEGNIWLFVRRR